MNKISDKQIAANRANAARSTGPRTPEGKSRAAQNARKHGLSSAALSILRLEEQNQFDSLKADAIAGYLPQTPQELFAVERIAICQLSMLRAYRLEAGMLISCLNNSFRDDKLAPFFGLHADLIAEDAPRIEQNRNFAMAEGFHQLTRQAPGWSLILRYQAQAERQYRRAVEDFERLVRLRAEREEIFPNEPISEETEPVPPENEPEPDPSQDALAGHSPAPGPQPPAPVGDSPLALPGGTRRLLRPAPGPRPPAPAGDSPLAPAGETRRLLRLAPGPCPPAP